MPQEEKGKKKEYQKKKKRKPRIGQYKKEALKNK